MRQQIAVGDSGRHSAVAHERRHAQGDEHLGDHRAWKATSSPCRRSSCFEKAGVTQDGQGHRTVPRDRRAAESLRTFEGVGHPHAGRHVRRRNGGPVMVLVVADIGVRVRRRRWSIGALLRRHAASRRCLLQRKLEARIEEVSRTVEETEAAEARSEPGQGHARPALCRLSTGCSAGTTRGSALGRWIEQSGT